MADLPIAECALAGPRFIARKPLVIGGWALAHMAVNVGLLLLMVAMAGPQMKSIMQMSASGQKDPQAIMQAFAALIPAYFIVFVVSLASYAVIYGAMNRAILRPQDSAYLYLRLGGDELRQGLLVVVYFVLMFILYLAAVFVGALVVGLVALAQSPVLGAIVTLLVVLAVLSLFIFLGVRLSLASALTFDTGRLNVFGGWSLSRGHFWPMLSVYLLCAAQVLLVAVIAGVVLWLVLMATVPGGDVWGFFAHPGAGAATDFLSPARLLYTALSAAAFAVILPISLMCGPAMYRALTTGRAVGEVFA